MNKNASFAEKAIERAAEGRKHFAKLYGVNPSCIVWCGNDKYIICEDGQENKIGFGNI